MAYAARHQNRAWSIRNVFVPEARGRKLRKRTFRIEQLPDGQGNMIVRTEGPPMVKKGTPPTGIVFRDGSFLVAFEKWSVQNDEILRYKYHYKRPDGSFLRYDMEEQEREGHPRCHLQASALGDDIRLPTGVVGCEEVLQVIAEQLVL